MCNAFGGGLQGETLFRTVIEVAGGGGGGGGGGGNTEAAVRTALDDYMARLPELLNMVEVHQFLCAQDVCWSLIIDRNLLVCAGGDSRCQVYSIFQLPLPQVQVLCEDEWGF